MHKRMGFWGWHVSYSQKRPSTASCSASRTHILMICRILWVQGLREWGMRKEEWGWGNEKGGVWLRSQCFPRTQNMCSITSITRYHMLKPIQNTSVCSVVSILNLLVPTSVDDMLTTGLATRYTGSTWVLATSPCKKIIPPTWPPFSTVMTVFLHST